ncbi:MAG: hypothetical protein ACFFHD_15280 [Promethearchaeota archaeon]
MNRKKKISKLQQKKNDPFSSYWERKCNQIFWEIFNENYAVGYCNIGIFDNFSLCHGRIHRHHLIKKENYLTKWEFENILEICAYHHDRFNNKLSAHGTPELFMIWLEENFPHKWAYIKAHKNIITRKIDLPWTFKEKYEELCKTIL